MNIEILEFYPLENNDAKQTLTGTLRIKLVDLEIEILGIYVTKERDFWYFHLPSRKGTHHETGNPVRYPTIAFVDRDKQRQLIEAIRSQGKIFVEKRLADKEKPLIFQQTNQYGSKQAETPKVRDNAPEPKKMASIEKPKPKVKEYYDLPPRSAKPTPRYLAKFQR